MTSWNLSRRDFLKTSAVTVAGLTLARLAPLSAEAAPAIAPSKPYESWQQLMAEKWSWDKTAKITHCVDCYPGNCSWTAYVKDGMVIREEQTGHYPQINPEMPDMNPRGCQKGASFGNVMYAKERIRYPIMRVGERGSGKWRRVTWDEALTAVA
ncbi:MAG: twin-arginine translocation signal domain-containing protein, partial [Deltaproteobacteria bacterium]